MEKLSAMLVQDAIVLDLKAQDKIGVIRELAELLIKQGMIASPEEFYSAILKRENLESTGIGQGIAIPHARTKAVKQLVLAFGRSLSGVDFNSLDGKPCYDIFLIAAPEEKKSEYIATLARLSKFLRREEVRTDLASARGAEEVIEIIKRYE
jgi:fructose PTS system EIIBC or EIIC component